jgi:hypothetical protein
MNSWIIFSTKANELGLAVSMDIIDEVREQAHIRARRYNSKVTPREMKEGDLVW